MLLVKGSGVDVGGGGGDVSNRRERLISRPVRRGRKILVEVGKTEE